MLGLELVNRHLYLIQIYATKSSAMSSELVEEAGDALRRVKTNKSKIPLGDFNAHFGNNARLWRGHRV